MLETITKLEILKSFHIPLILMTGWMSVRKFSGKMKIFKKDFSDSVGKYKTFLTTENSFPTQRRRYDDRREEFSCNAPGDNFPYGIGFRIV